MLLCKKYISAAPFFHIWHRKEYSIPKVRLQALFPAPAFRRHASALSRGAVCAKPVTPRPLRRAACLVFHSTRYPTPKRVRINSESPAASSFLRRRFTFTVSVFSSTKLSVSHSRCISSSRLTTWPLRSIRHSRMRYSFLVRSMAFPSYCRVWSAVFSTAPRHSGAGRAVSSR